MLLEREGDGALAIPSSATRSLSPIPSDGNVTADLWGMERDCQTVPAVDGDDRQREARQHHSGCHPRNPIKGYTVHASSEEPQYEIESDRTNHVAMHKGSAVRKLRHWVVRNYRAADDAIARRPAPIEPYTFQ
jgi:hypothetical protein